MKPGTILGSYEVVELIGAGGMGEVYRARDARLGRDVAVKLLPAALAGDPHRLQRFEQEARAAAALNDPHVVSVHDVGTHGGQPYVVSELLEGETLRQLLASGPLPIRRALTYAQQIARGMAAAHRRGIIHRDLKPENIFVTRDGLLKILDFGLAKLREPLGTLSESTEITSPGVVLGTVGYMSPEQARGEPADHRSDIFTFGAVLYEMLAGRRAFEGDSPADTLSAILKADPKELGAMVDGLPPGIERITQRCLEKRREDRFQSASDLVFALETLSGFSAPSTPIEPPRRPLRWAYLAAPVLIAAALTAGLTAGRRFVAADPPAFHQLTFRRGMVQSARFAPGGDTVLYAAGWEGNAPEIFSTRSESPDARSLQLTSAGLFAVSSKGEMALALNPSGFGRVQGTLARAALAGGVPRQLADGVNAADWSPDGGGLAVVQNTRGHSVLQYPVGQTLYDPTPGYITHVRFSPSGDALALLVHPVSGDTAGSVVMVDLEGSATTLSDGWNSVLGIGWSPDGSEVWFTGAKSGASQALYAVTRAGVERLLLRAPATLTLHDVSPDGRVLLTRDVWGAGVMALPRGAPAERDLSWLDGTMAWDLSADGTTAVLEESWEGGGSARSIYLRTMDGAPAVRLGDGVPLALSPDKEWIVSTSVAGDQLMLVPTGVGRQRALPRGTIASFSPSAKWLSGGRRILFSATEPQRRSRIYLQDIDGGNPRAVSPEGVFGRIAVLPGDTAFITRGLDRRLALVPLDGGAIRPVEGAEPGDLPIVCSPDGTWLYVQGAFDLPAELARVNLQTGRRETVRMLKPADPSGVTSVLRVVATPDGGSYAYTFVRAMSTLYLVEGVR